MVSILPGHSNILTEFAPFPGYLTIKRLDALETVIIKLIEIIDYVNYAKEAILV